MAFQTNLNLATPFAVPQGIGGQIFYGLFQAGLISLYLDFLQF